jgi:D-amino-acid oxidase
LNNKLKNFLKFINETKSKNYDYLINCTGLGSRQFVNDLNLHPVRGQVIRVQACWIKYCVTKDYETSYILPLDDCVVLGGTQQYDSYDLEVNENDCQNILEKCCRLLPSLKYAQIVKKSTGLRPIRTNGIRLELEYLNDMKVIHNYGHGGSGITLCLGCANNVVDLILNKL